MKTATRARRPSKEGHTATAGLRLLALVGDSPAPRVLQYVAGAVAGCRQPCVCLAYPLPALPPELLEFGGAEDPAKEKRLEASLRADQRRWLRAAQKTAQARLEQARLVLRQAGVKATATTLTFFRPRNGQSCAEALLQQARRHRCRTVVLGHRSHSWLGTLLHKELAEELLRRDHTLTVWLVGDQG